MNKVQRIAYSKLVQREGLSFVGYLQPAELLSITWDYLCSASDVEWASKNYKAGTSNPKWCYVWRR